MAAAPEVVRENKIKKLLEEEAFMILHSGETPEIALYSSIFYLFEDKEGPGLVPDAVDLAPLKRAVFQRYRKILLRDLNPANRDRRIYRGVARSIANWHRLKNFATRENLDTEDVRQEARDHLLNFLRTEIDELASGKRASSSINCNLEELKNFAAELGIDSASLPDGLDRLCKPG